MKKGSESAKPRSFGSSIVRNIVSTCIAHFIFPDKFPDLYYTLSMSHFMVIVTFDPRDALFLQKEQRFKHYATFVCECFTPLLIATKKILAKHSENPLEMFSTCVFNLHRFMESRTYIRRCCMSFFAH